MLKKFILAVFTLIMVVLLVACDNSQDLDKDVMVIKESVFSEETQKILEIINEEIVFFDYKIDETVKSMSIDIWTCEDGKWVNSGKSYGNVKSSQGQIAIKIDDDSYDIITIEEDGHTTSSYNSVVDFTNWKMLSSHHLSDVTEIKLNKEILLFTKLATDENNISLEFDDFRNNSYEAGVAVTVTFYDKSVD